MQDQWNRKNAMLQSSGASPMGKLSPDLDELDEEDIVTSMKNKEKAKLPREAAAEKALASEAISSLPEEKRAMARAGSGGWVYLANDDGSITIIADPRKNATAQGKTLSKGGAYDAIRNELKGMGMELKEPSPQLDKPKPKTSASSNARAEGAPPSSESTKETEIIGQGVGAAAPELGESDASDDMEVPPRVMADFAGSGAVDAPAELMKEALMKKGAASPDDRLASAAGEALAVPGKAALKSAFPATAAIADSPGGLLARKLIESVGPAAAKKLEDDLASEGYSDVGEWLLEQLATPSVKETLAAERAKRMSASPRSGGQRF